MNETKKKRIGTGIIGAGGRGVAADEFCSIFADLKVANF